MDSSYSVLTLEQGELNVPFDNSHQFVYDIEEKTGILSCCQHYYQRGCKVSLRNLNSTLKSLQVVSSNIPARRYFIKAPDQTFRVNIIEPSNKTVRTLLLAIYSECAALGYSYPTESYTLFSNSRILDFSSQLSDLPNDCTLELQELSTYPPVRPMGIIIGTLTGRDYNIEVTEVTLIADLKELIQDQSGIPPDQQRLIFAGRQLENHFTVADYNIQEKAKVHLVLRLRGGGALQAFTFNGMSNEVTLGFSSEAPEWRSVSKGISWIAICENSGCKAFRREVISNSGFGVFNANQAVRIAMCPMCEQGFRNIRNCGFFMAKWRAFGRDSQGIERRSEGESTYDNYTTFLDGDDMNWAFLRIEVIPTGIFMGFD